jgi:hypothetical protein
VFRENPVYLVDVGSTVLLVGILSQFTRCVSVDIRPIQSALDGLEVRQGTITQLPFQDNEVPCLSSMCVLEHIGLGRYGDLLNPNGTQDAVREIARVIKPGGIVIYSVPVGRVVNEFNANRRFSYEQASTFFQGWLLIDACILTPSPVPYVSDQSLSSLQDPVACFCVRKPSMMNEPESSGSDDDKA